MELKKLTKAQRAAKQKLISDAMLIGMTKTRATRHINKMLRGMNVATRVVGFYYNGKLIHETVALDGETKKNTERRVRKLLTIVIEE